jgi:hypothetical protein
MNYIIFLSIFLIGRYAFQSKDFILFLSLLSPVTVFHLISQTNFLQVLHLQIQQSLYQILEKIPESFKEQNKFSVHQALLCLFEGRDMLAYPTVASHHLIDSQYPS